MATAGNPNVQQARAMKAQYGAWPYPQIPLLASLPSTHPFELHASWLWDRSGSGPAPAEPRIWVAGCGTFQQFGQTTARFFDAQGGVLHRLHQSQDSVQIVRIRDTAPLRAGCSTNDQAAWMSLEALVWRRRGLVSTIRSSARAFG